MKTIEKVELEKHDTSKPQHSFRRVTHKEDDPLVSKKGTPSRKLQALEKLQKSDDELQFEKSDDNFSDVSDRDKPIDDILE